MDDKIKNADNIHKPLEQNTHFLNGHSLFHLILNRLFPLNHLIQRKALLSLSFFRDNQQYK